MHQGKLVFAQVMAHLPLSTFRRCVARYNGEHKVKRFSCLDQFYAMAFAQLTFRESLRNTQAGTKLHGPVWPPHRRSNSTALVWSETYKPTTAAQTNNAVEATATAASPVFVCRHCGAAMLIVDILARTPDIRAPPLPRPQS